MSVNEYSYCKFNNHSVRIGRRDVLDEPDTWSK